MSLDDSATRRLEEASRTPTGAAGRRVVFVNRYFHPDHSATSQIMSDLVFHLASRGWEVLVITGRQRYDDASARLSASESVRGVRIVRVWSTRFGRAGLPGRAMDYLTFYASSLVALRKQQRGSIVVAATDPPLLSVIAALASRRVVNWTQDLFPEVAEALGIRIPFVRRVRDWSLRRARANVVLGELMAARVPKAVVIHNWADGALRPVDRQEGSVFTVGYSGNLGRAHEFETIVGAMRKMPDLRFAFTGGGARLAAVKAAAPSNAEFRDYVPRERLSESLSSADAHLVSLQPSLEGLIVPSKFYGILAVARPVIFIGARDGELSRLIDHYHCGMVVDPGDVDGLVRSLRMLADDHGQAAAMGLRGRELYLHRFAPEHAFAAWERLLEECAA